MGSSRGLTSCQLIARGLHYEPGSLNDIFSRSAIETERRTELAKTMVIVNAIIGMGNHISAAVSGAGTSGKKTLDGLNKSLDILRELLVPEIVENTGKEAERAKALLKKEIEAGPISFRPVGQSKKSKKGMVKIG